MAYSDQPQITRRQFLAGSLGVVGALAAGSGCVIEQTPFEGIYTDRFTYRQSDLLTVYGALNDFAAVEISLVRWDLPVASLCGTYRTTMPNFGNTTSPGLTGAGFAPVRQISLAAMPPGMYTVSIPADAMQEANRVSNFNGFPSSNNVVWFVITADEPGSHSRLLWVQDSLTGVCYGSFGGTSIYGDNGVISRVVSYARPGQDRAAWVGDPLRALRARGFEFEFIDLIELGQVTPEYMANYDLVVIAGQFEYVQHEAMANLASYLDGGGNLFCAANEFALFRARIDPVNQCLTTYKWDFESSDPLAGTGSPSVAGIGMNIPDTFWETEITGQTLWAGNRVTDLFVSADLTLHDVADARWMLEGTGLGAGDVLPAAFSLFGTGTLIEFDKGGTPVVVPSALTRMPAGTTVWATTPAPHAREWWNSNGGTDDQWPAFAGWATATLQQRPSGARVVTLPSNEVIVNHLGDPVYDRILANIVGGLSVRR